MKLIAYTAAAALAFAPMAGLANDQAPVVQAEKTAVLPEAGGISQGGLPGFAGLGPEFFIFVGAAAFGIGGIIALAASGDDNNTNNTQ